jgi:hypothetical protein
VEVRRLDVSDEAPLETGAESLIERREILRAAVAGQGDLAAGAMKLVEGMVELDLGLLLPLEELHVV